jgi:glycerophosphoryl diester phosphodiesterase
MYKLVYSISLICIFASCSKEPLAVPDYFSNALDNTIPISTSILKKLEGKYLMNSNPVELGNNFVCLVNNKTVTFISNRSGLYLVMKSGYNAKDSSIILKGYFRAPLSSETGSVKMTISDKANLKKRNTGTMDSTFTITMEVVYGSELRVKKSSEIKYNSPFSKNVINRNFQIIAHRGGGRNSDDLPYSENSIEMIHHASDFGANSVEIDVKLTKDRIPVLYHDDEINTRLTQKSPLKGDIAEYKYEVLEEFAPLIRGEKIPTLEKTLLHIIDSTSVSSVWLDIKGDSGVFDIVSPMVDKALLRAKSMGKIIDIYMGIPTEEVLTEYKTLKNYTSKISACEISLNLAKELKSKVWGPRWTLFVSEADILSAHQSGIKVFTWTMDEESFIKTYIDANTFDGILSNYPSIVAYQLYSK